MFAKIKGVRETIVCITFLTILIGSAIPSWAQERSALIKENVANLYPKDFSAEKLLPSFRILEKPTGIDSLPEGWKINYVRVRKFYVVLINAIKEKILYNIKL